MKSASSHRWALSVVGALGLFGLACGGGSTTLAPPTSPTTSSTAPPLPPLAVVIGFVDVTAGGVSFPEQLGPGDAMKVTASYGHWPVEGQDVTAVATWESSNPGVATVANGRVQGIAPGDANIIAHYNGLTGSTLLKVYAPSAVTLTLAGPTEVYVGHLGRDDVIDATATLPDGYLVHVGAWAAWSSSDPSILTVAPEGIITGVRPGNVNVTATYQTHTATRPITVNGAVDTLSIVSRFGQGLEQPGRTVTVGWNLAYVLVSADSARVTLAVQDQNGKNIGSNPPVSMQVSKGTGSVSVQDTFVIPAGTTRICQNVTMTPAGSPSATAALPPNCNAVQ
jgi:hypothetical protein